MRHEVSSLSVLYGLHYLSHIGIPDDDKEGQCNGTTDTNQRKLLSGKKYFFVFWIIKRSRDLHMLMHIPTSIKTKQTRFPNTMLSHAPSWCDIKVLLGK